MRGTNQGFYLLGAAVLLSVIGATACQEPAGNTTIANSSNRVATNVNTSNVNTATTSTSTITTSEPNEYQANIKLTLETMGTGQKATMPTIGAAVARSGADRVMEFTLPTNEKVIYLDKGGVNYVILPGRKQYAELTKDAVGFEVRRLLMPEQIVTQVKAIPGMRLVGEETVNGRAVVKYAYSATADTQTQAGTVATESYVLVDKETSLPVRSETVSQSQSGANVQGVSGVRVVTEMTDIKTTPDAAMFAVPTDFQKIDPEQVKAQATLVFNAVGAIIGNLIQQAQAPAQPIANSNSAPAPAAPVR